MDNRPAFTVTAVSALGESSVTKGLVVGQILVTCVLLIGALLQVQSITRQMHLDYGYNTGALLSARLGLMDGDYPTNESRLRFHEKLLRELRADPALALPSPLSPVPPSPSASSDSPWP